MDSQSSFSSVSSPPADDSHQYISLVCTYCGHTISVPVRCGDRFCTVCNASRSRHTRSKLSGTLSQIPFVHGFTIKHLTLSTSNSETIPDGVNVLVKSFRRLRQRAFWKSRVLGGAYTIEVTGKPGSWHVHLHIVIHSRWLKYDTLLLHWNRVSGGLSCYIKNIPKNVIITYLTKYLTKSEVHPDYHVDVSIALRGTRLISYFGSWHNLSNKVKPSKYHCPKCNRLSWELLDIICHRRIPKTSTAEYFYKSRGS